MDPFESFKAMQKKNWAYFAPLEMQTTPCAARLVKRAAIRAGHNVLDVCCGTGVVSVTAARLGARVTGLDLTPELLQRARENAAIANLKIDWHEGDVEALPFESAAFDVVVSQFGHIFAPRPEVAVAEMLRVLKPGGSLLYADFRGRAEFPVWEGALDAMPLRQVSKRVINDGVVRSLDASAQDKLDLISKQLPKLFRPFGRHFAGVPGTGIYNVIESGGAEYRIYQFIKD